MSCKKVYKSEEVTDSTIGLLRQAYEEATKSPDPSTQNGALLVHNGFVLEADHNRFPRGVKYEDARWERPAKYKFIEHAERNVIYSAAKNPTIHSTMDLTMVCPWAACTDCARAIIQAGIRTLITHKEAHDRSPDRWLEEIEVAFTMLEEAGVDVVMFSGTVNGPPVRHTGVVWTP